MTWPAFAPLLFLSISNVFMTFAWYGQLRFPDRPLWIVVLVSWGIAFVEYCFAVPANRIGHTIYSAAQLKTMQEIITLIVFGVFSVPYLNEAIRWNHMAAFCCLVLAGYFAFAKWRSGIAVEIGHRIQRNMDRRPISRIEDQDHRFRRIVPFQLRGYASRLVEDMAIE